MTEGSDDRAARSLLAECIEDPAGATRRLPAVLGLLDADEAETRLAAAVTCCLVATRDSGTLEYVADRLADRRASAGDSLTIDLALEYLAAQDAAAVEAALGDAGADDDGARPPSATRPGTGGLAGPSVADHRPARGGVGRVRYPDRDGGDDRRTAYPTGGPDDRDRYQARAAASGPEEADEGDDRESDETEGAGGADEADPRGTFVRPSSAVSEIAARSRFQELHVLASQVQSRYSEDYRALVGQGAQERAIVLRVLDTPDESAVRSAFEEQARDALARWAGIDDHGHVVTLLDWGVTPRPWLATTFADEALARREVAGPEQALDDAIALAGALCHVHRNDVVHAGIDPGNVVYTDEVMDEAGRGPLLDNVGLLEVVRHYQNPATVLDPRYAAPEYFGRQFGRIDAATDVYQLGAVVYHLFAGRAPFDGSFGEVRDAVTSPATPVPGDVAPDVPSAVDEVVSKAMATRKLTRYETVDHLQQDLHAIREAGAG